MKWERVARGKLSKHGFMYKSKGVRKACGALAMGQNLQDKQEKKRRIFHEKRGGFSWLPCMERVTIE